METKFFRFTPRQAPLAIAIAIFTGVSACAQTLGPAFTSLYRVKDLGSVASTEIGGLNFKPGTTNTLLFRMNSVDGGPNHTVQQIPVVRGPDRRITGLNGTSQFYVNTPTQNEVTGGSDGSLTFNTDGVLLYSSGNDINIGQLKPGSTSPDKILNLDEVGYAVGGGLIVVPPGFSGAGKLKVLSGGAWQDGTLQPDGNGTYDVLGTETGMVDMGHDGYGAVYVPSGVPGFTQPSVIITSSEEAIYTYAINNNGDPIIETKRMFMTNIPSAYGITMDPVTQEFLISARGNTIYLVGKFSVTPPIVQLTQPANGTSYAAPASPIVVAEASQPGGAIGKVEFYLGEQLIETDTTPAPYEGFPQNLSAGTYALRAVATDSGGVMATSAVVNIVVTNVINQLPTVNLVTPTNNSHFMVCASVTLHAEAFDPEDAIAYVEFYNGSTLLGRDTTSPYVFTITNAAPGNYQFTARAVDTAGGSATSRNSAVMVMGPPPNHSVAAVDPSKMMMLCFNGVANKQYVIETKQNLTDNSPWIPVLTNRVVAGSLLEFIDPQTAQKKSAFFRLRALD